MGFWSLFSSCSRKEIVDAVFYLVTKVHLRELECPALCADGLPEFDKVDLSDCLIARRAKRAWCETLYTFERDSSSVVRPGPLYIPES